MGTEPHPEGHWHPASARRHSATRPRNDAGSLSRWGDRPQWVPRKRAARLNCTDGTLQRCRGRRVTPLIPWREPPAVGNRVAVRWVTEGLAARIERMLEDSVGDAFVGFGAPIVPAEVESLPQREASTGSAATGTIPGPPMTTRHHPWAPLIEKVSGDRSHCDTFDKHLTAYIHRAGLAGPTVRW